MPKALESTSFRPLRYRQIEVFRAVYHHGSVSGAARALFVTQPSVSKTLQQAEEHIGFKLFHRIKHRLVPTEEAKLLAKEVGKLHREMTGLQRFIENLREDPAGHIRIVVITGLGFDILPQAIAKYRERYPAVTFELQTEHYEKLERSLLDFENDIGLAFSPPEHPDISQIPIGEAEFACVYPPDTLTDSEERVDLREIGEQKFISMSDSGPLGDMILAHFEKNGVTTNTVIIAQTCFLAKSLVGYGAGVTIVDEFTAKAKGFGDVNVKKITPRMPFTVTGLYPNARPLSKHSHAFFECFQEYFEEYRTGQSE